MTVKNQKFQDISISSCCVECIEIGIPPHFNVYLSIAQVKTLLSLMQKVSKRNASHEGYADGIGVERLKDQNTIRFNGFVEIRYLLDSQWTSIYRSLKEWQQWSGEGDWHRLIKADQKAYQLFDGSLNKKECHALIEKQFNDLFDEGGLTL